MFNLYNRKGSSIANIDGSSINKLSVLYTILGLLCGIAISVCFFWGMYSQIENRLRDEITNQLEEEYSMSVEETYNYYKKALIELDPNSEWYSLDKHNIEVELYLWITRNSSKLSEEQSNRFIDLYNDYYN